MKCKNCGRKVRDDFEFCPNCGAKIVRELVCQNCGTKNEPDSLFCKKCGTHLTEEKQEVSPQVEKTKPTNEKKIFSFGVLSIIGMSLSILCMALLFSFLFIPCLSDSFMPCGDYTILSYISKGLSPSNTSELTKILSIVVLCLFIAVAAGSLVILGISIFNFVKALINKKYLDFSKPLVLQFSNFLFLFVLFVRFVISQDPYFLDSISVWVIILIVLIGLTLMLNLFLTQKSKDEFKVGYTIFVESVFLVIFTSLCLVCLFIGGNKFALTINLTSKATVGPFGFISELLKYKDEMTEYAITHVSKTVVYLGLSFLFEAIALVLCLLFPARIIFSKGSKFVRSIVLSSLVVIFLIVSTVFDSLVTSTSSQMNLVSYYGVAIICNHIIGQSIAKIIISGILFAPLCILWAILKKKGAK